MKMKMDRKKLAIIVACAVVVVMAIVLGIVRPWEGLASAQTYTLTTAVSPPGTGLVSPSGRQYESGAQVTVTATPASGYIFDHWSGSVSDTSPTISITMDQDYSITANFVAGSADRYDLTISSTEGGSVANPGEGIFTYSADTVVNLVATPASGYQFVNWTGDVSTVGNVNAASTTITVNGEYSIMANFEVIPAHTEITDAYGDVGLPINAPDGTFSGWDITGLELTYDEATDTMRVRINVGTILGDADGDGDPGAGSAWLVANGGSDIPNLGSSEAAAVFFDLNRDGDYDVIAGISGSTDYYGFSVNEFSGSFSPAYNFGTPLPGSTGSISPNPSATNPDLEFTIVNWSTLPGHDGSPGFCVGAYLGSGQDDGIGEDFIYACS